MPEIKDNAKKPEGVIPRKVQNYIILAISIILVVIVLFSSNNGNEEKIRQQINKIGRGEDLARTRELEQEIERFKKELKQREEIIRKQDILLSSGMGKFNNTKNQVSIDSEISSQTQLQSQSQQGGIAEISIEIKKDLKKREYKSLFTSNVALSYRNPGEEYKKKKKRDEKESEFDFGIPQFDKAIVKTPLVLENKNNENNENDNKNRKIVYSNNSTVVRGKKKRREEGENKKKVSREQKQMSNIQKGKFKVSAGTIIETVLLNRLIGDFTGPVKVMVTTPVYSNNFQHLLIPKGTIVLGEAKKVQVFGQERLAVVFHRLIFPNNESIFLDKFTGLDQIGATGLKDKVNNHYLRIFGASIMLGLISGWANSRVNYGYTYSGGDVYMSGVADSTSRSAIRILDKFLNVLPTITVREGHRVKVFLSNDLFLNEYEKEEEL